MMPCACPDSDTPLLAALFCFSGEGLAPSCAHRESSASRATVLGLECTSSKDESMRGFFVVSRDATGKLVCTGGDSYHLWVNEKQGDMQFAALSQTILPDEYPAVYWLNTSAARMAGTHEYELVLSLVETPLRALQLAERHTAGVGLSRRGESSLLDWLRVQRCAWQRVPLPGHQQVITITHDDRLPDIRSPCASIPRASSFAYRRLKRCLPGTTRCWDNQTRRRILDTSNEARGQKRRAQGFEHVLQSSSCRLRWFGEAALTRCLGGRSLLNVGSDAVDLQRGFARLNKSLVSWTRTRPGTTHPNVADFHRAFEKPWHQCFLQRGACDVRFGASTVRTLLKRGLVDLLPEGTASLPRSAISKFPPTAAPRLAHRASNRRTSKSRQEVLSLMCAHDIVVFESGIEDFALPLTPVSPLRDKSLLMPACSGRPAAECAPMLAAALGNETWRQMPLGAYRNRLHAMLEVWKGCKRSKPHWRGIFKLALAPRARALRATPQAADCERAQSGYSAYPHHVRLVNEVARHAVVEAGFEVFDPFAASLHASASWFDALPKARRSRRNGPRADDAETGLEYEVHSAEALSDMVTQLLLNQLCAARAAGGGGDA